MMGFTLIMVFVMPRLMDSMGKFINFNDNNLKHYIIWIDPEEKKQMEQQMSGNYLIQLFY